MADEEVINTYDQELRVGLIQTNCSEMFWESAPWSSAERAAYEAELWSYSLASFAAFRLGAERPHLVLMPELAVARRHVSELRRIAAQHGIVVIAGLNYLINPQAKTVTNEACVIVPGGWQMGVQHTSSQFIRVGKIYAAPGERSKIVAGGYTFAKETSYYLFDAGPLGRFGVTICYDLMDLERAALYSGEIQHLFVVAYNKDTNGFLQIADALSRVMFCNVVICNTGRYGGSVAISPYFRPWKRLVYKHEGAALATSQIVQLPVQKLVNAQHHIREVAPNDGPEYLFKNPPPVFERTVKKKTGD